LLNVAKENPDVLDDPKALVAFEEFGDSSLNFKLRCCITNIPRRYDILHEINTAIYKKLTEANIGIPFPQRDVNMKYPEGDRA
jgi:potassium efflux system protein